MARPHALNQLVAPGDIAEAVCFSLVRSAKRGASKLYRSGRTFGVFFADMVATPPPGKSSFAAAGEQHAGAREQAREKFSIKSSQVKSQVKAQGRLMDPLRHAHHSWLASGAHSIGFLYTHTSIVPFNLN